MKTLIIYATKYGSAEKAAKMLKEKLKGEVFLVNIMKEAVPPLEDFENVILGGSVYMGKIQKQISSYVKINLSELIKKRIGLFICAGFNEQERLMKELYDSFPEDLYDQARSKEIFGYEFHFEKMGFIERKMTSSIMGYKENVSKLREDVIENFAAVMNFEG